MTITTIHATDQFPSTQEDLLFRKVSWRILPIVFLCYVVAVIDRINVGFAKLQMMTDIGLSAAAYGLGAGIFFLAYCMLEVPSNLVLHRVGARMWLARIMVTWGLITIATGFVQTPLQFYIARIALGAAEAGFYPGVIYFLSRWFPAARRGRALALFIIAGPVGSMLVGPVAGWIMATFEGSHGLHGWQWIFILTGLPAIGMAVVLYAALRDRPEDVTWLSSGDKQTMARLMSSDALSGSDAGSAGQAFRNARVWCAGLSMATVYLGLYAIVFWTPSIIKAAGVADLKAIGWLSAIPYLCAVVATVAVGAYADRSGRHRTVVLLCAWFGAASLAFSTTSTKNLAPTLGCVAVAAAFFTASMPAIWTVAAGLFSSSRSAAAGIALINTLASIGSFFGPYLTGMAQEWTGSITPALLLIAVAVAIGGVLIFIQPRSGTPGRAL